MQQTLPKNRLAKFAAADCILITSITTSKSIAANFATGCLLIQRITTSKSTEATFVQESVGETWAKFAAPKPADGTPLECNYDLLQHLRPNCMLSNNPTFLTCLYSRVGITQVEHQIWWKGILLKTWFTPRCFRIGKHGSSITIPNIWKGKHKASTFQ